MYFRLRVGLGGDGRGWGSYELHIEKKYNVRKHNAIGGLQVVDI